MSTPWLLLIHQMPPKPIALRLRVWRRLQRVGAVAIKNSVWALPVNDQAKEDFEWLRKEIEKGGGEATVIKAELVEGLSDAAVQQLFHSARDAEYAEIASEAKALRRRGADEADLTRLRRRLDEVKARDHLGAPGQKSAEVAVDALDRGRRGSAPARVSAAYRGRTWVTRRNVFVDRMACAWLIGRFVDDRAQFRYVDGDGYRPARGEIRFDMFEGEFTHEGDRCSFEVMARRFAPKDRALAALAEIIHDIDFKDDKFGREEAPGMHRLLAGIAASCSTDPQRVARAGAVFDDLYAAFQSKRTKE